MPMQYFGGLICIVFLALLALWFFSMLGSTHL